MLSTINTTAAGTTDNKQENINISTSDDCTINEPTLIETNITNEDVYHSAPTSPTENEVQVNHGRVDRSRTAPPIHHAASLSPSMKTLCDPFVLPMPPKGQQRIEVVKNQMQRGNGGSEKIISTMMMMMSEMDREVQQKQEIISENDDKVKKQLKQLRQEQMVDVLMMEETAHSQFLNVPHEPTTIDDVEDEDEEDEWYQSIQGLEQEEEEEKLLKQKQQETVDYTFAWSVAAQQGYRYTDPQARVHKLDIHSRMEDMHYPSYNNTPNHVHPISGRLYQVFMLADGHGGHGCAEFTRDLLPGRVCDLINSHVWHFDEDSDRKLFKRQLEQIFLKLDEEYCEMKLEQFRQWIHRAISRNQSPLDATVRSERPADDGCTVVLNIFYEGYMINANVGDSRSLVLSKQPDDQSWSADFASIDHTPGHPERARQIHMNGGRFIMNGSTVDHGGDDLTFDFLSRCRIGRPIGWKISELNFPACTTLNLAGTMGDLFFKYDPPLISARPDVSFVKMQLQESRYLLIMASDGLWDHMSHQAPQIQHQMISDYVTATLDHADVSSFSFILNDGSDKNGDCESPNTPEDVNDKLRRLGILAHVMADREMRTCKNNLYAPNFIRYDDVTVFVVLVEGILQSQQ